MSKLTVIQLLNKIANGEEVPERIKVDNIIYRYENWEHFYYTDNEAREDLLAIGKDYSTNDFLNWNVEIIEEQQDIDIQAIKKFIIPEIAKNEEVDMWDNRIMINKLIQAVKQLDKKIREE